MEDNTGSLWFMISINFEQNIVNEDSRLIAWMTFNNGRKSVKLGFLGRVMLPTWLFTCLGIDTKEGLISFKSNNIIVAEDMFIQEAKNLTNVPTKLTNHLKLGAIQLSSVKAQNIHKNRVPFCHTLF